MKKQIMLILEAGADGPQWIHLLAMGELPITKEPGFIRVDAQALGNILGAFARRGNDLVIDYEHQTLGGGEAPAAGWIKELEARPDGLWARVEWTDKASAYLRNREYRYFSPVLPLDEENRPLELYNAALTNFPAITNLPPLVAKRREGIEMALLGSAMPVSPPDVVTLADITDMRAAQLERSQRYGIGIKSGGYTSLCPAVSDIPDEYWGDPVNYRFPMPDPTHKVREILAQWRDRDNREDYSDTEQGIIEARIISRAQALGMQINQQEEKAMPMTTTKGVLGLPAEAQETEVLAAVQQVVQQGAALKGVITSALGLPETAKPEEITGAITALKGDQGKLQALITEVAALKDREITREAEAVVEEAMRGGKLIPAERELALADAKRDMAAFKARLAVRPKIVPLGEKMGVKTGADGHLPSGTPADQVLALKAQQLAAKEKIDLAEATRRVFAENPELAARWQNGVASR